MECMIVSVDGSLIKKKKWSNRGMILAKKFQKNVGIILQIVEPWKRQHKVGKTRRKPAILSRDYIGHSWSEYCGAATFVPAIVMQNCLLTSDDNTVFLKTAEPMSCIIGMISPMYHNERGKEKWTYDGLK